MAVCTPEVGRKAWFFGFARCLTPHWISLVTLMTRRTKQSSVILVVALAASGVVHAQQNSGPVRQVAVPAEQSTVSAQQISMQAQADILKTEPPPMRLRTPETIVESFLRTEARLRQSLNQHTFKREVVLQTIGPNGEVTGQYVRNSEFLFDDRGRRIERVTYHPPSTIREMRITKEDIQDLAGAQLLGIDITESTKYRVTYCGEELLAGQRVFVLSVEPAIQPNPYRMNERYFRGTVWIDAATYQMVRVKGMVEPQGKQRFPQFETWREILSTPNSAMTHVKRESPSVPNSTTPNDNDSKPTNAAFAFPSRTEADDVLHFPKRDVNYRIRVRYYDYKLFASTVSVKELDQPAILDQSTTLGRAAELDRPATLTARTRP